MKSMAIEPDQKLRAALLKRLAADRRTSNAELRVGVVNGIVHLAGKTGDLSTRAAAAELAAEIPGVRGVVNRIEAPGAPSPARPIHLDLLPAESKLSLNEDEI